MCLSRPFSSGFETVDTPNLKSFLAPDRCFGLKWAYVRIFFQVPLCIITTSNRMPSTHNSIIVSRLRWQPHPCARHEYRAVARIVIGARSPNFSQKYTDNVFVPSCPRASLIFFCGSLPFIFPVFLSWFYQTYGFWYVCQSSSTLRF